MWANYRNISTGVLAGTSLVDFHPPVELATRVAGICGNMTTGLCDYTFVEQRGTNRHAQP